MVKEVVRVSLTSSGISRFSQGSRERSTLLYRFSSLFDTMISFSRVIDLPNLAQDFFLAGEYLRKLAFCDVSRTENNGFFTTHSVMVSNAAVYPKANYHIRSLQLLFEVLDVGLLSSSRKLA
jgi:hypothetical protein